MGHGRRTPNTLLRPSHFPPRTFFACSPTCLLTHATRLDPAPLVPSQPSHTRARTQMRTQGSPSAGKGGGGAGAAASSYALPVETVSELMRVVCAAAPRVVPSADPGVNNVPDWCGRGAGGGGLRGCVGSGWVSLGRAGGVGLRGCVGVRVWVRLD